MSARPLYKAPTTKQADDQTRSKVSKEPPDHLLSYYQSSIPNGSRSYACSPSTSQNESATHHTRKLSLTSMSSDSDYSYDSEKDDAFDSDTNVSKPSKPELSSPATRRPGTPSKGGADRRRMAIVQMDSVNERAYKSASESTSTSPNSIRSRRGLKSNLTGLALVAPPDAALRTYSRLTPPSTAPVAGDYMNHHILTAHHEKGHNRSASENSPKPSSRDAHLADRLRPTQGTQSVIHSENNKRTKDEKENNASHSLPSQDNISIPVPMPRSPSPDSRKSNNDRDHNHTLLSPSNSSYPSASIIDMFSPIVTPNIGEGKEIHVPVAGPVVVKLEDVIEPRNLHAHPAPSWRNESPALSSVFNSSVLSNTSAYLHYEPGLHATAGPLPPPPRETINIKVSSPPPPRPPRLNSPAPARMRPDIQAVKQALQLPSSVTAVLESKAISRAASKSSLIDNTEKEKEHDGIKGNTDGESQPSQLSIHRREGATLSNSLDTSSVESSSPVREENSTENLSPPTSIEDPVSNVSSPPPDSVDVKVVEAPIRSKSSGDDKIDTAKFDQWLKDNPGLAVLMSTSETPRHSSERPASPMSPDITGEAPSPPPKSLRNSISNNLKRFSSLPRTPSLSSRSESARQSSSRTPSPSLPHVVRPPFKKILSSNPSALFCHEVHSQNTTLQRCSIYVSKINELYLHDCGLSEWVIETKSRGSSNSGNHGPRAPSSQQFVPQPRQTSRSSMISEATFPIRPDASTATDLSHGAYRDITPPGVPPALPYPSLAVNPPRSAQPSRSNSSVTVGTPPSIRSLASAPSTKGAGFFASLGRKASLSSSSRRDRLPMAPGSNNNPPPVSGRLPLKTPPTTASISRPIPITNPPSVPGGPRALPKRAQRSQTFTSSVSPSSEREDPLGRRPSLFNLGLDTVIDIQPDPAFVRQVDQLAALLPHADRDVLAGYLRRAGQDMLAIGQYLEDERMGTIRQP